MMFFQKMALKHRSITTRLSRQRIASGRFEDLLDLYSDIYGLRRLENRIVVDKDFFSYCQRGQFFILVILVNALRKIYYRCTLHRFVSWELPGGFVEDEDVSLEAAATRIVRKESGLSVDELRPFSIMINRFIYGRRSHKHYGIAFIAQVRNRQKNIISNKYIGRFMKFPPKKLVESDRGIIRLASDYLRGRKLSIPYKEIDEFSNLRWRYFVHVLLIRPIQHLISSRSIRKEIAKEIRGIIILDVSCGDDTMITNLANAFPQLQFIANDICWDSIKKIINKPKYKNIIFTNHNIEDLPYQRNFDTVIFKNTLHHFNYSIAKQILENLYKLSNRRLIVVDVENPNSTNIIHFMWNRYYKYFLHDQGENFWQFNQFKRFILSVANAHVKRIKTNRGNYMLAIYNKKINSRQN